MGLWGFFGNNYQDDSKRLFVNKWLDTLEPPDQESYSEPEFDIDVNEPELDIDIDEPESTTPTPDIILPEMPQAQRYYDLSTVQFATWQDPFKTYAPPQYGSQHPAPYTSISNPQTYQYETIVSPYQVQDDESSSEEEDEEEEEVGKFIALVQSFNG
jgi:hypothetical protein